MRIMPLILAEYANELNINIYKIIKIALIHDIVEIDAGGAFLYAVSEQSNRKKFCNNLELC